MRSFKCFFFYIYNFSTDLFHFTSVYNMNLERTTVKFLMYFVTSRIRLAQFSPNISSDTSNIDCAI